MAVLTPYKDTDFYFWKFLPSQPASITFLALFTIITILHCWRMYKLRSWFCSWFVIGCFCEITGFSARIVAYEKSGDLAVYIFQISFLVIAPAFFAASIYMTLSRIIRSVKGEHHSLLPIRFLTKFFVIGDFVSLNVQGGTTSLIDDPETAKIGEAIVIAGLFVQLVLLAFFMTVAITFHLRLRRRPTNESLTSETPWEQTLYMVYVVVGLIFGRSVFRVMEYMMGHDGYLLAHEWSLYVFEAVPMFAVTVAFWYWYPGYIQLPPPVEDSDEIELTNRGKYARVVKSPWISWLWGDVSGLRKDRRISSA